MTGAAALGIQLPETLARVRIGGARLDDLADAAVRLEGPHLRPASAGAHTFAQTPQGAAMRDALRGVLELYRPDGIAVRSVTLARTEATFDAARLVSRTSGLLQSNHEYKLEGWLRNEIEGGDGAWAEYVPRTGDMIVGPRIWSGLEQRGATVDASTRAVYYLRHEIAHAEQPILTGLDDQGTLLVEEARADTVARADSRMPELAHRFGVPFDPDLVRADPTYSFNRWRLDTLLAAAGYDPAAPSTIDLLRTRAADGVVDAIADGVAARTGDDRAAIRTQIARGLFSRNQITAFADRAAAGLPGT